MRWEGPGGGTPQTLSSSVLELLGRRGRGQGRGRGRGREWEKEG